MDNRNVASTMAGIAGVALAVCLVVVTLVAIPQARAAPTEQDGSVVGAELRRQSGLTVSGQGSVRAQPDLAVISVGVQSQAEDARQAIEENSETMAEVLEAIRDAGVEDSRIQTVGLNIQPIYSPTNDFEPRGESRIPSGNFGQVPEIAAYRVTNTVFVELPLMTPTADTMTPTADAQLVGEVLDAAFQAGANIAGNLQFSLEDRESVVEDALRQAVENAESKARVMATALGVTLGNPILIIEDFTSGAEPMPRFMPQVAADASFGGGFAPPVEGGEIRITTQVRVTYSITSDLGRDRD